MTKYWVIRHFQRDKRDGRAKRIIKHDLTLEEAQTHCQDPESASTTCTSIAGKRRTKSLGAWFDGYDVQPT